MNDRDVIDAFVAYLRDHGHPGLQVDLRPEDENRTSADIDAIAGTFAIEHTSIDALPNQRRDSDWYMRAVGGLDQELQGKLLFRLTITLKYAALTKGQDWATIREGIKIWIANEAPRLLDGHHVLDGIPGVPFQLDVRKKSGRPPGVFFGRFAPDDDTLPDRIREQLDRKAKKLAKYQSLGKTTVLLVENDDIALMNERKLLDAIQKACPGALPAGVDQFWYVDTSSPSEVEFRNESG